MAHKLLSIAVGQRVQAIWLSFGEDLGHWIRLIRARDRNAPSAIKVFVQISTVEQAVQAVREWKADVIVIQGPQLNDLVVEVQGLRPILQGMKQEDTALVTAFHF